MNRDIVVNEPQISCRRQIRLEDGEIHPRSSEFRNVEQNPSQTSSFGDMTKLAKSLLQGSLPLDFGVFPDHAHTANTDTQRNIRGLILSIPTPIEVGLINHQHLLFRMMCIV